MDKWILTGPSSLTKEEQKEAITSNDEVKVRISHLLVSEFDYLMYSGAIKTKYPRIIGRNAIGIVTEAGSATYGLARGTRVYMSPARSCKKCLACKSGHEDECIDIQVAGRDFDGFLRDFVVCNYRNVSPLPDTVDGFRALCIEYVALAENIYDQFHLSAGSRIAIVGGNLFATVLAQVLLYHKIVPIVIDNNARNLEAMAKSGVYYAFAADDDLDENVAQATSGSMCDGAVYTTGTRLNPSLAFRVVARGTKVILSGFCDTKFTLEAQEIVHKNLTVLGMNNGYGYTETAINMIVNGVLNLDMFEKKVYNEFDPEKVFGTTATDFSTTSPMTVIKFIL
jgi:threonine dehydrogenase-like Zn-dependent dehydrogenase